MSGKSDPLNALFPAKLRRDLLTFVFLQPSEAFHVSALARHLDVSRGALTRELADLTASGILSRSTQGNQVLYEANREAPFFAELHALIQRLAGAIPTLRRALQPFAEEIDVACVFGSMARGDARPDSDIDLLLIGDGITGRMKAELRVAMKDAGRKLDILELSHAQHADLLDENGAFIQEVIRGPLIMLLGNKNGLENAS